MSFSDVLAAADRSIIGDANLTDSVRYAPSIGEAVEVQGIFDRQYVNVDAGGEAGVSSSGPAVWLLLDDLPTSPNPIDDEPSITVDEVEYEVKEARPDGKGGVLFLLRVVT